MKEISSCDIQNHELSFYVGSGPGKPWHKHLVIRRVRERMPNDSWESLVC